MTWFLVIVVMAMAPLAGSPWLLAHRAERRRLLQIIKMRRIRLRTR